MKELEQFKIEAENKLLKEAVGKLREIVDAQESLMMRQLDLHVRLGLTAFVIGIACGIVIALI